MIGFRGLGFRGLGFLVRSAPNDPGKRFRERGVVQAPDSNGKGFRVAYIEEWVNNGCREKGLPTIQNSGCVVVKSIVPFLSTLNIRCRIIIGIQKRTTILTITHIAQNACFADR